MGKGDMPLGFRMVRARRERKEREKESVVEQLLVLVEAAIEVAAAVPIAAAKLHTYTMHRS